MTSHHFCDFKIFQLTTLFQRGPVEDVPRCALNVDHVTISRRAVESAISCVQSYVGISLFTQRHFFTDHRISILLTAVNVAGCVSEGSVYEPWNRVLPERYVAVVRDLNEAFDVIVIRRQDARDTFERWFGGNSVECSVVGGSSVQQGVRMSNVVEVGEVEYLAESVLAP